MRRFFVPPLRLRYYHSAMDTGRLRRGQGYAQLKESHVVFICLDDPFGLGLPVYEFNKYLRARPDVALGYKQHKWVYNVSAYQKAGDAATG